MSTKTDDSLSWSALLVPAALGIVAGFLYYNCLASQMNELAFATLNQPLAKGTVVSRDMFVPAYLSGDTHRFRSDGILYRDIATIEGFVTSRPLAAGTFVIRNDLNLDSAEPQPDEKREIVNVTHELMSSDIQVNAMIRVQVRKDGELHDVGPFRVLEFLHVDERGNAKLAIATMPPSRKKIDPEYKKLQDAIQKKNGYEVVQIGLK